MTSRKKVPVSTFGHVSSPHSRDASVHQLLRKYLYPIRSYWHFPKSKTATAAILDFQFMCIWPFRRVDRAVFVFCTKFGSNICYSHWDRHTYASDLNLMTSRELPSGFDFWSHHHMVISASPWCIFPYNLMQDIVIQSKVIDIFPKFNMAIAAILDFQFMWIWPFRRVGSVVFVFCTKFGSNICYSNWDRRIFASDLHLMTSRELTSGLDFWSRGRLRVAGMHLPI